MSDASIVIHNVHKRFGRTVVLDGLSLEAPRGSIFGFLGLNGAGKSTTIQILLGLLRADGGTCRVVGLDPAADALAVRRRVGYMAENQTMYGWMTIGETLAWSRHFYPEWDGALAAALLEQMRLPPKQKVGALSKGQASRLALLLALAHRPELVILDDPALGLDPLARRELLRDVIGQLQSRAVTVFFSSHLLYEIEPICDHVAILHEGRIVAAGPVDAIKERVRRYELATALPARLGDVPGLLDLRHMAQRWTVTVADGAAAEPALRALGLNGQPPEELSLDEIFEAYVAGRIERPVTA